MKAANELYFLAADILAEAVAYLQVRQRFASKPHAALLQFTANRVGKRVNGKWQIQ